MYNFQYLLCSLSNQCYDAQLLAALDQIKAFRNFRNVKDNLYNTDGPFLQNHLIQGRVLYFSLIVIGSSYLIRASRILQFTKIVLRHGTQLVHRVGASQIYYTSGLVVVSRRIRICLLQRLSFVFLHKFALHRQ